MRRITASTSLFLLAACGSGAVDAPITEEEVSIAGDALEAGRIAECTGLPRIDRTREGFFLENRRGMILPAYPRDGEEIFVSLRVPRGSWRRAFVRFTADQWRTQRDLDLQLWCDDANDPFQVIGYSLGTHSRGARLEAVLAIEAPAGSTEWLNNGGANYRLEVGAEPSIHWVGDTHVRIAGEVIHPDLAPAGQDLQIYTQTHPAGPMNVELFVSDANYQRIETISMTLERDGAGPNRNNTQWTATIPADRMRSGEVVRYWIRARDARGGERWDSRDGANYQLNPRSYPIVWAGGFGRYRPTTRMYDEGGLFQTDGSTAFGCNNHGASASSYVVRAVRVYVPGLTDQPEVPQGATAILRAELYTELTENNGGWRGYPATFARKVGNDFIYTFLGYSEICGGGFVAAEQRYANRNYGFKMRFSTDGGRNWFWRGAENGPWGGADLFIRFQARCDYFGNPNDCIP